VCRQHKRAGVPVKSHQVTTVDCRTLEMLLLLLLLLLLLQDSLLNSSCRVISRNHSSTHNCCRSSGPPSLYVLAHTAAKRVISPPLIGCWATSPPTPQQPTHLSQWSGSP
jgi:hypothetical protein